MPAWIVYHDNHAGTALGEANPMNLRWGRSITGPGYITYDLPNTSPLALSTMCKPYVTDFRLQTRGGGPFVMGGMHTEVSFGDVLTDKMMHVAGKDWLHYLERIIWPKDPNSNYRTTTAADPTNGTVFDYTGSVSYLVYKLIDESTTNSGIADTLAFGVLGTPSVGSGARYRIEPGDTQTIAQHIDNILALGSPTGTKFLQLNNPFAELNFPGTLLPEYGTGASVTYKFNANVRGGNCKLVGFKHGGVRGTRVFGIAQGPSSRKGAFAYSGGSTYRRLDIVEEYNESSAFANLQNLVNAEQADGLNPDIEIQIQYYDEPEIFNPFINELVYPGTRVEFRVDLGWSDIVDTFSVMSVECQQDNDGVSEYTATLNLPNSTT